MDVSQGSIICGRKIEFFNAGTDPDWGYENDQTDSFAVIHPKDEKSDVQYPLYVIFHSAGHDLFSTVGTMWQGGNHDIYHSPENCFALVLDCRAHWNDWWWGGFDEYDQIKGKEERSGVELQPVEKRCMSTIFWTMDKYSIDENRVYAVGNSMGGTGALGIAACRGDVFAAIKVNVPAGVLHMLERCGYGENAPEGYKVPDFPIIVDYSAQNDMWSKGHEKLYAKAITEKIPLMGFWGNFGHENNDSILYGYNDLIHSFDIFTVKKNEAYPVFTNASTDDKIPWPDNLEDTSSGQVNAYFRWNIVEDSENRFEVSLRLLRNDEWETRVEIPKASVADVSVRRLQNFKFGSTVKYKYGDLMGEAVIENGIITIPSLEITDKPVSLILE